MATKRVLTEDQKERKRLKERERRSRIKAEQHGVLCFKSKTSYTQAPVEQAPESAMQVEPDPAPESAFNRVLDHSDFLRLQKRR